MVAHSLTRTKAVDPHGRVERLLMYVRLKRVLKLLSLLEKQYLSGPNANCASLYMHLPYARVDSQHRSFRFERKLRWMYLVFGAKIHFKNIRDIAGLVYRVHFINNLLAGDRRMNASTNVGDVIFSEVYVAENLSGQYSERSSIGIQTASIKAEFLKHCRVTSSEPPQSPCPAVNTNRDDTLQERVSDVSSIINNRTISSFEGLVLAEAGTEGGPMLSEPYDYCESHTLKKIDGFLVTDGRTKPRITLKDSLSSGEKQRGRAALRHYLVTNAKPGVYLWRATD
jgi:hypothetical protein